MRRIGVPPQGRRKNTRRRKFGAVRSAGNKWKWQGEAPLSLAVSFWCEKKEFAAEDAEIAGRNNLRGPISSSLQSRCPLG